MNTHDSYTSERLLGCMMILQFLSMLFPRLIPSGFAEVTLCIGLFAYILCKLQVWDHAVKRKYNEGGFR